MNLKWRRFYLRLTGPISDFNWAIRSIIREMIFRFKYKNEIIGESDYELFTKDSFYPKWWVHSLYWSDQDIEDIHNMIIAQRNSFFKKLELNKEI